MEKVIRDGMVAVLYSPEYGAGWSTWTEDPELQAKILFDANIVNMVGRGATQEELEVYCYEVYPDLYPGAVRDLTVAWLPIGTEFIVREYDGSEQIVLKDEITWSVA